MKEWFLKVRKKDCLVNGLFYVEKQRSWLKKMGEVNFVATDGWFQRWKKRENIVYGKAFGEQLDANIEGAEMWPKTQWPALIAQYSPDDIFNADETGLYFRALPELIYFTRNEKAKCCKTNKKRLTILASRRWYIF